MMEKIGDVFAFLPETTKERARSVVAKWVEGWPALQKKYRDMMPNAEIQTQDLFWHAHLIGEFERRAEICATCDTTRWIYMASEDAPQQKKSCRSPLVPVLKRTGHRVGPGVNLGRLQMEYLHCSIYREWANRMQAENAKRTASKRRNRGTGRKWQQNCIRKVVEL